MFEILENFYIFPPSVLYMSQKKGKKFKAT